MWFDKPFRLEKACYGQTDASNLWFEECTEWLQNNDVMRLIPSESDPGLFVYRNKDGSNYLISIIFIDDALYFGSDEEIEKKFEEAISKRFNLTLQGWSHWFLSHPLHREADGSYFLDQERVAHGDSIHQAKNRNVNVT